MKDVTLKSSVIPIDVFFNRSFIVDLFYMKTCHFRGAQPRLFGPNKDESEGILCQAKPVPHYGMKPCRRELCFLCQPRQRLSGDLSTVVHFSQKQIHRFVNKYEAILNCPAVRAIGPNISYS